MVEEAIQESDQVLEVAEEAPVDEMGALKEQIGQLKKEMEELRDSQGNKKSIDEFSAEAMSAVLPKNEEVSGELERIVSDFEGGRFKDALSNLLEVVNRGNQGTAEVVAGGAIERESFMSARGLEDLHGKVDLAMELRRHGIPRADVVRLLRASAAKPEPTRVEEPTARVARPVDENKIIEGYWKKALG